MDEKLVYIGKIISRTPIEGADLIESATVVCGPGGKWNGIVGIGRFKVGDLCLVYLPDSVIPESEELAFMKKSNWRVKMQKFKGAPSEVLIMPMVNESLSVGTDCTTRFGVTKYHKPVPAHLQGIMEGKFPDFIPKTDEPNYQNAEGAYCIEQLEGKPYYSTEKCDGSSTTAYKYKGHFGVCSRNWEMKRNEKNGYWMVALKYDLENKIPEGFALQWETCGPGIQSNPMGLKEIEGFAFSAYKIDEHRFLTMNELIKFCVLLGFPTAQFLSFGPLFSSQRLELLGEGRYKNGKPREGVVVRSQENFGGNPLSFKVINLNYEK